MTTKRKRSKTVQVHQLLLEARKRLKGHWTQMHFFYNPKTKRPLQHPRPDCDVCMLGALYAVAPRLAHVTQLARTALRDVLPSNAGIIRYNDAHGRTEAEVLHMLDLAIIRARKLYANQRFRRSRRG